MGVLSRIRVLVGEVHDQIGRGTASSLGQQTFFGRHVCTKGKLQVGKFALMVVDECHHAKRNARKSSQRRLEERSQQRCRGTGSRQQKTRVYERHALRRPGQGHTGLYNSMCQPIGPGARFGQAPKLSCCGIKLEAITNHVDTQRGLRIVRQKQMLAFLKVGGWWCPLKGV